MLRLGEIVAQLLPGLWVTGVLFVGGAGLAAICALTAGLARVSQESVWRALATVYVEVFRGTSALVQLFWFYFALPILLGIRLPAMVAGILVLGLNLGAYGAEVVRGAIRSVPRTQLEAAVALNLSRGQTMRHVVLPQALRAMLPPFGNLLIELLKSTALVSMITVADLTRVGLFLRDDTLRTGEIFGVLLLIYFVFSQGIAYGVRSVEKRLARSTA